MIIGPCALLLWDRGWFVTRLFEGGYHLFPLYARKALEKIIDRISTLKMIKQALHWNPCPYKHRCATENRRIAVNDRLSVHERKVLKSNRGASLAFA